MFGISRRSFPSDKLKRGGGSKKAIRRFGKWSLVLGLSLALAIMLISFRQLGSSSTRAEFNCMMSTLPRWKGVYKLYGGVVYVELSGGGYFPMPEIDTASFRLLRETGPGSLNAHVGVDRHHAYCGHRVVEDMNPDSVRFIGYGYYTDGRTTYYFPSATVRNPDLPWFLEIFQPNPLSWVYPMRRLPDSDRPYVAMEAIEAVTDGHYVYYEGERMQGGGAGLRPLRPYAPHASHGSTWANCDEYTRDGEGVYLGAKRLEIRADSSLFAFEGNFSGRENSYLVSPRDGMVYASGHPFEECHAPYRLISDYNEEVYHTLGLSYDGVYYYDPPWKRVVRAGDNPFASGDFREIAPLVFTDGSRVLYMARSETRWSRRTRWGGRGTGGKVLITENTELLELNLRAEGRVIALKAARESIFQLGDSVYLLGRFGRTMARRFSPIYRIADSATLAVLLESNYIRESEMERLLDEGKLVAPGHTQVLCARSLWPGAFLASWRHTVDYFSMESIYFDIWHVFTESLESNQVQVLLLLRSVMLLGFIFWRVGLMARGKL